MILPFSLRLMCLSLASFFLLHLAFGTLLASLTRPAIRLAARFRPQSAANFLFALRLLPSALAALFLTALCIPSYLLFEPPASLEKISPECALAALLAFVLLCLSFARTARALAASLRFSRHCRRTGHKSALDGTLIVNTQLPLLAVIGLLRSRIVMSKVLLETLSPEQLAISLRHERAHAASRDNLKRLVLLLAPDLPPFVKTGRALELAWSKFAEWAADDHAVVGDANRAVTLAETLIQAARLGQAPNLPAAASSLLAEGGHLSQRIHRLIGDKAVTTEFPCSTAILATTVALMLLPLSVALSRPDSLVTVHDLLEYLIR